MKLFARKLRSPMAPLYDEASVPPKIRKSLDYMLIGNICGGMFGVVCFSLTGCSTAMVGLATALGANDLVLGILAAIPQITAIFQIPFSIVVNRTHKRKRYMLTIGLISRALWMSFGFIPLLIPEPYAHLRIPVLIFMLSLASILGAMINVTFPPWFSDISPLSIRARWMSIRESLSAVANVLFGLATSYMLDHYPLSIRFVVVFILGGAIGSVDMLCFKPCEDVYHTPPTSIDAKAVFRDVFKNKPLMRLTLLWTVWSFTTNLSSPYLNPYAMNEMGLNFTQIMIFGTTATYVVTAFAMPRWGQALNRFGSRSVMLVSCIGASISPLFYLFSVPGSILPTLLHNFLGTIFLCGANLTSSSLQLAYSPSETGPSHLAVFGCITAVGGITFGTLTGGALLEYWHSANMFAGSFDRYKVLIVLSVALRLGLSLMLVPRLDNDKEGTAGDLVRSIFQPGRKNLFRR